MSGRMQFASGLPRILLKAYNFILVDLSPSFLQHCRAPVLMVMPPFVKFVRLNFRCEFCWALVSEKNGKSDAVAITVPASMTMTELEISTAERIANECYQSNYQNCPE